MMKEAMRNTTTEGAISILEPGKTILRRSANRAGATSRNGIQLASCRTKFHS